MKHALSAVAAVVLILALTLGSIFVTTTPAPAASPAQDTQGCVLSVAGIKVCGTLLGQPLPEVVTVTVPPITLPPVTVTDVVTVRPDPIRLTETIRPDPVRVTETVTAQPQAQPTATATATATQTVTETIAPGPSSDLSPTVTETVRPNGQPIPTATETVTLRPEVVEVTRQSEPESGTVEPSNEEDVPFFSRGIDFGDDDVTAGEAGVGLLGALLILLLIFGGMAYGFRRGIVSSESEESDFLRKLLDRSKTS